MQARRSRILDWWTKQSRAYFGCLIKCAPLSPLQLTPSHSRLINHFQIQLFSIFFFFYFIPQHISRHPHLHCWEWTAGGFMKTFILLPQNEMWWHNREKRKKQKTDIAGKLETRCLHFFNHPLMRGAALEISRLVFCGSLKSVFFSSKLRIKKQKWRKLLRVNIPCCRWWLFGNPCFYPAVDCERQSLAAAPVHPSISLFSPGFSASDREALQSPTVGRPPLADRMLGSGGATAVIMWFCAYGVQLQPNQLSATGSGAFANNQGFFLCWTQQHNSASSRIHAVSYYVVFIKVSLLCLSRVLPSLLCNLILRLSCSVALLPTEGSSFSLTLTPPSPFQPACVLGWWMSAAHWLERSGLLPPCLIRIITALCALFLSRITIQFNTLTGYYHFTSFCSGSWTRGESRARGGGQNTEPKQG